MSLTIFITKNVQSIPCLTNEFRNGSRKQTPLSLRHGVQTKERRDDDLTSCQSQLIETVEQLTADSADAHCAPQITGYLPAVHSAISLSLGTTHHYTLCAPAFLT